MSDTTRKDHAADERERQRQAAHQTSQPAPQAATDEEIMKIRKAAGAIAEVIEPVQRVRQERTN
jgi:hypothetical protein